jgi:hypothetical protein
MFENGIYGELPMPKVLRLASIAVAAAAVCASSGAALAKTVYVVEAGNWNVMSLANSCIAFNRPSNEYNHSPFNSLTLRAPKEGGVLLQAAFWPQAFAAGSGYQMSVRADPGDRFTIDAGAMSDYMLESKTPIPEELVKQLGKASFLTVRVADIPAALGFDAVRLRDVLVHLDNCRRLLAGD